MSKNRFANNETVDIDLGDGDIITVKKSLSFKQLADIQSVVDEKNPASLALPMMKAAIVGWNLKNGEEDVPCTPENVDNLDVATCSLLMEVLTKTLMPEKKS